jgi:hypothetical protein
MEENENFVYGMEGSLQRSEGSGDGEVAVLLGVIDQEAIKDQRRMRLSWRNHLLASLRSSNCSIEISLCSDDDETTSNNGSRVNIGLRLLLLASTMILRSWGLLRPTLLLWRYFLLIF